jgi:hypothetical protein
VYFTLASVWGFLSGCVGLLAGIGVAARPPLLDSFLAVSFLTAGLVAVGGGIVASRAYREASRKLG